MTNGLVLDGTLRVGNPTNGNGAWTVDFAGSQLLAGNGAIVFGNRVTTCDPDLLRVAIGGTILVTLGPGITVSGQAGFIGS